MGYYITALRGPKRGVYAERDALSTKRERERERERERDKANSQSMKGSSVPESLQATHAHPQTPRLDEHRFDQPPGFPSLPPLFSPPTPASFLRRPSSAPPERQNSVPSNLSSHGPSSSSSSSSPSSQTVYRIRGRNRAARTPQKSRSQRSWAAGLAFVVAHPGPFPLIISESACMSRPSGARAAFVFFALPGSLAPCITRFPPGAGRGPSRHL